MFFFIVLLRGGIMYFWGTLQIIHEPIILSFLLQTK